jgi:4-carboxymuconolactone decarboxylase
VDGPQARGTEGRLDPEAVAAIAARRSRACATRGTGGLRCRVHLLGTGRLPAALHARATEALGERGLVELVGVLGYYSLVALTLNAFEIGLPDAAAPELEDPEIAP